MAAVIIQDLIMEVVVVVVLALLALLELRPFQARAVPEY